MPWEETKVSPLFKRFLYTTAHKDAHCANLAWEAVSDRPSLWTSVTSENGKGGIYKVEAAIFSYIFCGGKHFSAGEDHKKSVRGHNGIFSAVMCAKMSHLECHS